MPKKCSGNNILSFTGRGESVSVHCAVLRESEAAPPSGVFPGELRKGGVREEIRELQQRLNYIAVSYPALPVINTDGFFSNETVAAVKAYQDLFGLPVSGVCDKATWQSITYVCGVLNKYAAPPKKGENRWSDNPCRALVFGDNGCEVLRLQHHLNALSRDLGEKRISPVTANGRFDEKTRDGVTAFQRLKRLPKTGVADKKTLKLLNGDVESFYSGDKKEYPGKPICIGSEGEDVVHVQNAVNAIKRAVSGRAELLADGMFGEKTKKAVAEVQELFGLPDDGIVDKKSWMAVTFEASQQGTRAEG